MYKRKIKFFSTIIAFLLCFPFHFIYDKYPNFITSILFPVNESIWEHMKLLFSSIIISGLIEKIILIIKKEDAKNVCFSNYVGAILSIPIFLLMFLPFYYLLGHNFIVTILIMLTSIVLSEYIAHKISLKEDLNMENKTIVFLIITFIIFGILTYYPLDNSLFLETENCIYEII